MRVYESQVLTEPQRFYYHFTSLADIQKEILSLSLWDIYTRHAATCTLIVLTSFGWLFAIINREPKDVRLTTNDKTTEIIETD